MDSPGLLLGTIQILSHTLAKSSLLFRMFQLKTVPPISHRLRIYCLEREIETTLESFHVSNVASLAQGSVNCIVQEPNPSYWLSYSLWAKNGTYILNGWKNPKKNNISWNAKLYKIKISMSIVYCNKDTSINMYYLLLLCLQWKNWVFDIEKIFTLWPLTGKKNLLYKICKSPKISVFSSDGPLFRQSSDCHWKATGKKFSFRL